MRFALYMTASTVHFMSARLTMHVMDESDWLSFAAAFGMLLMGTGFLCAAIFDRKEGRDG